MTTKDFTKKIKKKAVELGFQKIGIAKAGPISQHKHNLEKWIENGGNGSMSWIERRKEERGDVHKYFPEAKSVVSLAMNYYTGYDQTDIPSNFKFSNYAWGDDYHNTLKKRLFKLLDWLNSLYPKNKGLVCVDTAPIMEKVWAQKAGLGWQGKHTNLITSDHGSWLFLGELILDIPLEYDEPFIDDLCGSCTACIDACPTKALGEYTLDSKKCISYKTIEYRGQFIEEDHLDNWIYGCDICQEVCPWNQKFSKVTNEKSFLPKFEILNWDKNDWSNMNEEKFRKTFKGSSVKRTKFSGLSRNIEQNLKNKE